MITDLRAVNFKSWRDTGTLRLGKLTGLFGTNSSGKTSILQALLMLKQTAESADRQRVLHTGDERSLVDLGTFSDLIHGHQANASLVLDLHWTLPEPLVILDPANAGHELFRTPDLGFTTTIGQVPGAQGGPSRPFVESFAYTFGGNSFGMHLAKQGTSTDKDQYDLDHGQYELKRARGRPSPLPSPAKCYGFPDEAMGYYQNTGFLPSLVLELERLFAGVAYLGPLRDYPRRSYLWAGGRPSDVGRRGELAVPALLAARAEGQTIPRLVHVRHQRIPVALRIAEWLKDMKLIDSFRLESVAPNRKDYELHVRVTPTSSEVLITDVGFGVSQVLPVLVLCYCVPEGSTILLEQPEIHLHPSVQATLADVFIDVVQERNVQIIVESHSEHLLARLQRRIAEEKIAPEDIALYFCRMGAGASEIEDLHVDLFGNIANWPPGFFGDDLGEAIAMTEAGMRRQGAGS